MLNTVGHVNNIKCSYQKSCSKIRAIKGFYPTDNENFRDFLGQNKNKFDKP